MAASIAPGWCMGPGPRNPATPSFAAVGGVVLGQRGGFFCPGGHLGRHDVILHGDEALPPFGQAWRLPEHAGPVSHVDRRCLDPSIHTANLPLQRWPRSHHLGCMIGPQPQISVLSARPPWLRQWRSPACLSAKWEDHHFDWPALA